jgi:hypothetical protein
MAMDPLTAAVLTLDEIRQLSAELLTAHQPYLPEEWKEKAPLDKPVLYNLG